MKIHLDTDLGGDTDDLCALACAVALGWEGVTIEDTPVGTELRDGWLHEQGDEAGQVMRVVTAVEGARFSEFWLSLVTA